MRSYRKNASLAVSLLVLLTMAGVLAVSAQLNPRGKQARAEASADFQICHLTSSTTNPYELITVPKSARDAHFAHGDISPTGGSCPSVGATPTPAPGSVPEPITMLLFGSGLAGVGYAARRLRKKGQAETDSE